MATSLSPYGEETQQHQDSSFNYAFPKFLPKDLSNPHDLARGSSNLKVYSQQLQGLQENLIYEGGYWCTFLNCSEAFSAKGDWKRHERFKHLASRESWRCDEILEEGACATVCYESRRFETHLKNQHQMSVKTILKKLEECRIGRNSQVRFWCGFCGTLVNLTTTGLDTWSERREHILDHVERSGQRFLDWVPVNGHKPIGMMKKTRQSEVLLDFTKSMSVVRLRLERGFIFGTMVFMLITFVVLFISVLCGATFPLAVKILLFLVFGEYLTLSFVYLRLRRNSTETSDVDTGSQNLNGNSLGLPETPDVDTESPQSKKEMLDVNTDGQHFNESPLALPNSSDVEAGRQYIWEGSQILLHGEFQPDLYTLVRLSKLEGYESGLIFKVLDGLGKLDEILSMEELSDESWELPVLKSHVPKLQNQLSKHFPCCYIESDNDPTEPNDQEIRVLGYPLAKLSRTGAFCERAKRMEQEAFPRAVAFYSHLRDAVESGRGLK